MPTWARYTGAIYFGLMMSGALAPPDWGVASAPSPSKHAALDHAKGAAVKHTPATAHKPPPAPTLENEQPASPAAAQPDRHAQQRQRFAPRHGPPPPGPPLPSGPDLLR